MNHSQRFVRLGEEKEVEEKERAKEADKARKDQVRLENKLRKEANSKQRKDRLAEKTRLLDEYKTEMTRRKAAAAADWGDVETAGNSAAFCDRSWKH